MCREESVLLHLNSAETQPLAGEHRMSKNYKTLTVKDLVDIVNADKKNFPLGMDTPITSGDFEGNYYHKMHEPMTDRGKAIFLGYEMHENCFDE